MDDQYISLGLGLLYVIHAFLPASAMGEKELAVVVKKSHLGTLGRMGRILGRFGTDVGTDKMCKIANVYRPWDGGTDKLGGRRGMRLRRYVRAPAQRFWGLRPRLIGRYGFGKHV